ncbi:hypothetical protein Q7P37_004269 [Cladosporium fusiforme]
MSYNEHLTAGLAAAWDCTTEEAEKRLAAKRKRTSHESIREDIPWTAARCNRLLRTITSRVNILRRHSKLCTAPTHQRAGSNSQHGKQPELQVQTPPPSCKSERQPPHDPEWVPGLRPRTTARTYAGKSKLHVRPATKKSDSGFSTPFVKRLLATEECSTVERPLSQINWNQQIGGNKATRQLPVQLGSSNEEAQRNLVTAFGSLLTATSESPTSERAGAPSLLSSCLRRVPEYIGLEVEELDTEDNESEDVCSSIYAELESLGTNSNAGWLGLREVVRAQCIQHVRAAIHERLVHDARVSELISACSRNGALREADSLLQSWIARDTMETSRKLENSHPALTKLSELRLTHHSLELYLRRHTDLITSHSLWISDALRPGSAPLKDMIKALVRGHGQDAALSYLEAAISEDGTASNSTSLPIFTRLAGLLASIALTQPISTESHSVLDVASIVHRIAVHSLQFQGNGESKAAHPFVMASALLHLAALPSGPTIVAAHIPQLVGTIIQHQSTFVKFACNVIHHVFRFSNENELRSLLLTTTGFLNPPVELCAEQRDSLSRLAFEIAFTYAEQTGINIDQHFADGVVATDRRSGSAHVQTPRRRVQVAGFKWEEGLCEWVAATPLLQRATEPILPKETHPDVPKQLPTPKRDRPKRASEASAIPSSPDVIVGSPLEAPKHEATAPRPSQSSHVALKERSANARLSTLEYQKPAKTKPTKEFVHPPPNPKQAHLKLEREKKNNKKATQPIVPAEGKQVHLKEEKAKRAALLAAQASHHERKRPHTSSGPGGTAALSQLRVVQEDTDELGISTPAKKRACRGSTSFARSKSMSMISLSRPVVDGDGMMSDDELGL